MPWSMVLSMSAHHGEAANPELLEWFRDLFAQFLTVGPWTVVAFIGMALIAFPIGLVVFYLVQDRRVGQDS